MGEARMVVEGGTWSGGLAARSATPGLTSIRGRRARKVYGPGDGGEGKEEYKPPGWGRRAGQKQTNPAVADHEFSGSPPEPCRKENVQAALQRPAEKKKGTRQRPAEKKKGTRQRPAEKKKGTRQRPAERETGQGAYQSQPDGPSAISSMGVCSLGWNGSDGAMASCERCVR
eukprot:scaffold1527_cov101-Isochrysis_galbana.AAC.2